jgi:hypothetical protein
MKDILDHSVDRKAGAGNVWAPKLEAMYGRSSGDFAWTQEGRESFIHPDDRADAVSVVEQAFNTGRPVEGEWRAGWPMAASIG